MSFMFAQPQLLMEAASNLAGIGSTLSAANTAAALPISSVMAAGADEVSAAMAAVFGAHAQQYKAMSAQAANLHSQFVDVMGSAGNSYANAEAANASPLQSTDGRALNSVNAQAQGLLGAPGVGGQSRTGPVGGPVGPVGNGGSARTGTPGRLGGVGPAVATGGAGGVGGAVRANDRNQAATMRSRNASGAGQLGPGGPGAVGTERDLRATYAPERYGTVANETFAKSGPGTGGSVGPDGLRGLSAPAAESGDRDRLRPGSDRLHWPAAPGSAVLEIGGGRSHRPAARGLAL